MVPYIWGTGERFKKVCKSKGIQVHFKGINTFRTLLVTLNYMDPKLHKRGVVYHFKWPHINCFDAYIGESGRALGERIKKHLKAPSPIHQHSSSTGQPLSPECFNIIILGNTRFFQEHQGSNVYTCKWPLFKLEPWEISIATHLCNILQDTAALQLKQPSLTTLPILGPPLSQVSQHPPNSSLPTIGGGTCTFFGKHSKWGCLNTPKPPYIPPHVSPLFLK